MALVVKHYSLAEWADFARHLLPHAKSRELQLHLDSGCAACQETVLWFQQVDAAAAPAPEPPPELLQRAIALFAPPAPAPGLAVRIAKLVYDSLRDPLPVGIRSAGLTGRQALFEAGDYCVDMRLEQEGGSSRVALTGQIANSKQPENKLANLPVLLLQGEKVIERTTSNDQGEFCLEYRSRNNLRLSIPVAEWSIVVRLNALRKGD